MRLSQLVQAVPNAGLLGSGDPQISRVDYDSRQVQSGSLFVAISGAHSDGHQYISSAIERGAVAVMVQNVPLETPKVPLIVVPDTRRSLAIASGEITDHPDRKIDLVGITGTNGKTTTVFLLATVFKKNWGKSGLIGTLGGRIGDQTTAQERTTPEAPDIHRLLLQMVQEGCSAAAMEVSSHALAMQRVYGLKFACAAFTNLSQDHLDFHGDLESYFYTKASLFEDYSIGTAVINLDDIYGKRLLNYGSAPVITYSLNEKADIFVKSLNCDPNGIHITVGTPRMEAEIHSTLKGRFNAYNLLCAAAVNESLHLPWDKFAEAVSEFKGVPGRMEEIRFGDCKIYVDYAHTPGALEAVLNELNNTHKGPIHVLFGCGGERDKKKRPLMGRAAEKYARKVYLTTDNPRGEDPEVIIAEIKAGMKKPKKAITNLDRRRAIAAAIHDLPGTGVLLIAGKGHEDYQEIAGVKLHFNDAEEVRRILSDLSV